MKYGYTRVSTVHQDLEGQIQVLKKEGCQKIFQDKLTGTNNDRPELQELLKQLKTGDTLVIIKLDRLARSAIDGIETIKQLFKKE